MQGFRTPLRFLRAGAVVLAGASLARCAPAREVMYAPVPVQPAPAASAGLLAASLEGGPGTRPAAPARISQHVVVISVDGLRPDAIDRFGARTLQRLAREGSHSFQARTILPSVTLPSHTSMLTGEEPERHGIDWNNNQTEEHGHVAVPTIFGQAREAGLTTAAFFSKGKFAHLLVPGSLDYAVAPAGNGTWLAGTTAGRVERYLAAARPNLLFVHIGDTDYAGHAFGWMGRIYGMAVRHADGAVRRVLAAADGAFGPGNYTVIVTADHGGHGRTHGSDDPRDVTIPWIAWGKGVRDATVLPEGIHTTDTAATALWLLGLQAEGTGRPVLAAVEPQETAPATAAPAAVVGAARF